MERMLDQLRLHTMRVHREEKRLIHRYADEEEDGGEYEGKERENTHFVGGCEEGRWWLGIKEGECRCLC